MRLTLPFVLREMLLLSFVSFALSFTPFSDSIYALSIKTIDGKMLSLSSLKGKKLLFVVLPRFATDTVLPASALKAVSARHTGLVIIGLLSQEAGFKMTDKGQVKQQYKHMPDGFILTEVMRTLKTAGKEQAPLLQWLTYAQRNKHFDSDLKGPGHKFFVDEKGELYGVLDPSVKISSPLIDRVINRK